ncbi:hypothetical protein HW130_34475 [Streptomyces sp. PKU-EA00015]|uniref:hypothetical protein n=1 Tax=Streptomyces sp. PKU-EA00015 TaxID=2748326 RepID=UPI0015A4EAF3|nr:hypothetical protein [Streptomyces sp. PKU-EA00015]NWF31274.1 hypothetical protein [Streptomyces sp. PKU-EA00015]
MISGPPAAWIRRRRVCARPTEETVRRMARALLDRILGPTPDAGRPPIVLPTRLVVRESS